MKLVDQFFALPPLSLSLSLSLSLLMPVLRAKELITALKSPFYSSFVSVCTHVIGNLSPVLRKIVKRSYISRSVISQLDTRTLPISMIHLRELISQSINESESQYMHVTQSIVVEPIDNLYAVCAFVSSLCHAM